MLEIKLDRLVCDRLSREAGGNSWASLRRPTYSQGSPVLIIDLVSRELLQRGSHVREGRETVAATNADRCVACDAGENEPPVAEPHPVASHFRPISNDGIKPKPGPALASGGLMLGELQFAVSARAASGGCRINFRTRSLDG